MSFFRSAACVVGLVLIGAPLAAETTPLVIEVDSRELPRRLIHTTLEIPCEPGPLRLWYPKWFPGSHGPYGRVEDVAGFRVETPEGRVIPWERDEVSLHCFRVEVPDGVTAVRVKLDTICERAGTGGAGIYTFGNNAVGVINWNTCLVYPEGVPVDEQTARVRLRLPAGWRYATALKSEQSEDDTVTFRPVSLTTLVDNPLIAGRHLRTIELDAGETPPAFMHLVSESPEALKLSDRVVGKYSRLVREAGALFGVAHYPEYHFLVVCSDDLGTFGLEHAWCSLNGVGERGLIDDRRRKGWLANLLPHEYAHSWCGKYRRPKGMITPDFHTPQRTRLLWVYEGLTEYLGEVLMVRSGITTPEEYRVTLANEIRELSRTTGREWRPLDDTAVAGYLFRNPGSSWNRLRRGQDFYMEGMLLWYECDAIIRERTDGEKSLDDFCRRFFARVPGDEQVIGYEFADVVRELNGVAEFDWEGFLRRRVSLPQESLPLDVVNRLGYEIRYDDKPGPGRRGDDSAGDSLGMTFANGRVVSVVPGMPGDGAGLYPGLTVIGVNGKKFSPNRLRDAIADSVTRKQVEFLLEDGEDFRTVVVPYEGGLRYLELAPVDGKPDVLGEILKPRTK